jgi:hypothetical protein
VYYSAGIIYNFSFAALGGEKKMVFCAVQYRLYHKIIILVSL